MCPRLAQEVEVVPVKMLHLQLSSWLLMLVLLLLLLLLQTL